MPSSTVSGYRLDRGSGALTLLGTQLTGGQDACFVTVSPDGKWLLCANFTGGSVCVLPIGPDGAPGCASCILRHAGRGSNPQRQASPHPHQIVFSPDGRFVYVSDLGLDRLVCYRLDPLRGWLQPAAERDIAVPAGQGARHFVFNRAGTRLYLMLRDISTGAFQIVDREKEKAAAAREIEELLIKTPSSETKVVSLSGGNQQKCILGRWLEMHPKLLILDEPTRGIDVGAKTEIYKLINSLAESGIAVIMAFCAVSDRRSVTPHSRNRLPSISEPISGATEGRSRQTKIVTMIGNRTLSFLETGRS